MSDMGMNSGAGQPPDVSSPYDFAMFTPGIMQSALINSRRYGNTMLRGGFHDVAGVGNARQLSRAKKFGGVVNGQIHTPGGPSSFIGGASRSPYNVSPFLSRRAARASAAGKTAMANPARINNLNPRAINRLNSVAALGGGDIKGAYNPFQVFSGGVNSIAGKLSKNEGFRKAMGLADDFDPKTDRAFSGGVLGRIDTLNKINNIEKTIAVGQRTIDSGGTLQGRAQKRFIRAQAQRTNIVNNIAQVQSAANPTMNALVNNPSAIAAGRAAPTRGITPRGMAGARTAAVDDLITNSAARANMARISANPSAAVASTMTRGTLSNRITTAYHGVLNAGNMTRGQQRIVHQVSTRLGVKSGVGTAAYAAQFMDDFGTAGKYAGNFMARGAGGTKMMGMAAQYARAGGSRVVAAKMGAMGAARLGGAALGPLNVLSTGQLMYDIGKGIGKMAVGGINFAKDAMKSMQGTINKPMFGTGFKDNEVAATSRSRGVMAIQNSRLNARSLLGSEASMMAAHFG
jgi:hypothetical protein